MNPRNRPLKNRTGWLVASAIIIGSVAWDEVVMLASPLVPGSHNAGHQRGGRVGGGAANTAMAMARAGDSVQVISSVGSDAAGDALLKTLADTGVDIRHISRQSSETTRSLVMLDGEGERTVVNLSRASVPLPEGLSDFDADWVYVRSADSALTPVLQEFIGRNRSVMAHVPPVKNDFRPATILVGSASDLDQDFLGAPFKSGKAIAGDSLQSMVVTYGSEGAVAYGPDGEIRQTAPSVQVVDSTGAGDVFTGGLMHALSSGVSMGEALETAVAWGSLSVTYAGTVPPDSFPSPINSKDA